jgi:hypothetical protein
MLDHSATEKSTSWLIFHSLTKIQSGRNTAFFKSIEMLDAFRYGKINQLVDFSRTRSRSCRPDSMKSGRNTAFSSQSKCLTHSATEKSTSWLIFPGLAHEVVARFKEIWQKHGVFKSIEMLDAFRYGKINQLVDFSRDSLTKLSS